MKVQNLSKEYLRELGHRLKIIRTILKIDQKQMSKLMKTGQSQISKIESGNSAPSLFQLKEIKRLSEQNDNLKENLTWEWIIDGKGKGLFG